MKVKDNKGGGGRGRKNIKEFKLLIANPTTRGIENPRKDNPRQKNYGYRSFHSRYNFIRIFWNRVYQGIEQKRDVPFDYTSRAL